jgi:hypothetical protein
MGLENISRLGVRPGSCDGTVASAKAANPETKTQRSKGFKYETGLSQCGHVPRIILTTVRIAYKTTETPISSPSPYQPFVLSAACIVH